MGSVEQNTPRSLGHWLPALSAPQVLEPIPGSASVTLGGDLGGSCEEGQVRGGSQGCPVPGLLLSEGKHSQGLPAVGPACHGLWGSYACWDPLVLFRDSSCHFLQGLSLTIAL